MPTSYYVRKKKRCIHFHCIFFCSRNKRNWNRGLPTDCNSTAECIYIRMRSIAKMFFEDTYSTHLDWISEEAEGCRFRIAQYLPTRQVSPGNVWRSCEVCSISQHVLQQLAHHSSNFTPHYHHSTPRSSTTGAENTIHHHWSVIYSFQRSFWVCCDVHNVVYSVKVQWKIVLCFYLLLGASRRLQQLLY